MILEEGEKVMNKSALIEKNMMDCPICDNKHEIEKLQRETQAIFKGELVDYTEIYFVCRENSEEENEFVPAYLMDENLLRVRDAYREKKGLLTSAQISAIRRYYGLTQSDYSFLLGWGEVTVTRYETKTIQDETYDNIMRLSYENPMFAIENLKKHKNKFALDRYKLIYNSVAEKIVENANIYLIKQQIYSLYVNYDEPNEFNGNKLLDINKIADLIYYFAATMNNLYKVKLMKLLWYADAIFYARHNVSMTGLIYRHMPLGALPIAYNEILMLPTIRIEEEFINEIVSYRVYPKQTIKLPDFTLEEQSVIELVCVKFEHFNTLEIVNYMHEEMAYKETPSKEKISYNLSKVLNELS